MNSDVPESPPAAGLRSTLWVLLQRNLRASVLPTTAALTLLFAFFSLGTYLYSAFGETTQEAMASISPEFLMALFGGVLGGMAPVDLWLITLFAHPLLIVVLVATLVGPTLRDLCGEIDRGTIDLLLGCPIPRWLVLVSVWITAQILLLLLCVVLWLALHLGGWLLGPNSPESQAVLAALPKYFTVLVQFWLLGQSVVGIALWFGAAEALQGKAMGRTLGVVIFSYFLNLLAGLWSLMAPLRWLSIFHYYQPQPILAGEVQLLERLALLALSVALLGCALYRFQTRDIEGV